MPNRRILFAAAVMATIAGCATYHGPATASGITSALPPLSTLSILLAKAKFTETLNGADVALAKSGNFVQVG